MNYIELLQDSWRIFRIERVIWVFGFLTLLITLPFSLEDFVRNNSMLVLIYLPILYITMIAYGALYFMIHQASLKQIVPFSRAWSHGRSKMLRLFGIFVFSIPILLLGGILMQLVTAINPTSPFLWLIIFVEIVFAVSFLTFGSCAVTIDNVRVWAAAGTSFLITINNLVRVFIISGTFFLLRLLITVLVAMVLAAGLFGAELPIPLALDYPTYQHILTIPMVAWANWLFNLLLFPLEAIMLTLVYLKSTREVEYPALPERQTTA